MDRRKPVPKPAPQAQKRARMYRSVSPVRVQQPSPQPQKPNLQNAEVRKKHVEEEAAKVAKAQEKAKKLRDEQIERKKAAREKLKKRQDKIKRMENGDQNRAKRKEDRRLEEYKTKLAEQVERGEKRKNDLETRFQMCHSETRKINSERPPLYRIIEDQYNTGSMLPELENRKAVLAKKRDLHQPLNHDEMQDYMKQHKEMFDEMAKRRKQEWKQKHMEHKLNYVNAQNMKSSFTDAIKNADKEEVINRQRAASEARALADKRGRYADIVKEMYVPTIDKQKQMELQILKERQKNPPKLLKPRTHNVNRSLDSAVSASGPLEETSQSSTFAPKKFKANTMVPLPKPKKQPVKVDYLADRRKQRQETGHDEVGNFKAKAVNVDSVVNDSSLPATSKLDQVKRKAQKAENEARKQELLISELPLNNLTGIEAAEEVNTMLISSIKAKLAVLGDEDA